MSAPTEAQGRAYWHPALGDLTLWYPTFEVFASTCPPGNRFFHAPHIAAPVDLDRVVKALREFEEKHADELTTNPLPTLEQLRSGLEGPKQSAGGVEPTDEGSPCHNFWHWIHGD